MSNIVTSGAQLQCTLGTDAAKLIVSSGTGKVDGNVMASISDFKSGSNITSFGKCSTNKYKPCTPAIMAPWKCSNSVSIDGKPSLTDDGMNNCMMGGVITIKDAGAKTVEAG